AAGLAAVAEIERSDAKVLEEGCVIGARTEGPDAEVPTLANLVASLGVGGADDALELAPLPDGDVLFRVLDVARHTIDELLERVGAAHEKVAAPVRVAIDVHGAVVAQFVGVRLRPFGISQQ